MKLRTQIASASTPPAGGPGFSLDRARPDRTPSRIVDLTDALGPGWQLLQDDSDRAEQRWHLEHDHTRVGTVRRAVTTRGRTAWSARTLDGYDVAAASTFAAAAGSTLWRTRDLAAAGLARNSGHH